jgi:hypothetical protein
MSQLFRRKIYSESDTSTNLLRVLGVWDIVFFGIAPSLEREVSAV